MLGLRLACVALLVLAFTGQATHAQGMSRTARGALLAAPVGGAAGLLFAHDSCDGDPCNSGAYVVAALTGGALFAGSGAVIASRVRSGVEGRGARHGAILGGVLGAIGGVVLIATTCDSDECGPAGYTALGLTGAAVFATVGSLVGRAADGSSSAFQLLGRRTIPVMGVSPRRVLVGIRTYR